MLRQNCWEVKKCGRQLGGTNSNSLGICPVTTEKMAHGINSGTNGGRVCWVIAGTFCGGKAQGTFAKYITSCIACEFYKQVKKEEGKWYKPSLTILKKLKQYAKISEHPKTQ